MNLYQKAEKIVADAFTKANKPTDVSHAKRTAYWIKQLKPDAEEGLLIAGLAHDIERAFYGDWKAGSSDAEAIKKHQNMSADEVEKFLRSENADENLIARVRHLVEHHEEGGNENQNILCDADALAFFEEKAARRVKKWVEQGKSKEEIKKSIDYYFSRITSEKAKQIAMLFYEEAISVLNK